jgi:hypothetical protein
MKKTTYLWLIGILAIMMIAGCGGGGNAGSGSSTDGRAATLQAGRAAYLAVMGNGIGETRETGSPQFGNLMKFAKLMTTGVESSRSWSYDSSLDLYYQAYEVSNTQIRVDFRTSGGTSAGYLVLNLIDGEPYPVTIRMNFDFTSRGSRYAGTITYILNNSEGSSGRTYGDWTSSAPQARITFDLTLNGDTVTGQWSMQSAGNSIQLRNIRSTSQSYRADYVVGGYTGSFDISASGAGNLTCNTSEGIYALVWNSSYLCTLRYPNGQEESVGYLYRL